MSIVNPLNRRVAEAFGWKRVDVPCTHVLKPSLKKVPGTMQVWLDPLGNERAELPPYSTNIHVLTTALRQNGFEWNASEGCLAGTGQVSRPLSTIGSTFRRSTAAKALCASLLNLLAKERKGKRK